MHSKEIINILIQLISDLHLQQDAKDAR